MGVIIMSVIQHLRRALALGAAAATAAIGLGVAPSTATAAPAPRAPVAADFLDTSELPPSPHDPWVASPVRSGLPINVRCAQDAVTAARTWHRSYGTELDAWGLQLITTSRTTTAAKRLTARIESAIKGCADAYRREHPEGSASWRDFGRIDIEEGAHVYGVTTSHPDGEPAIMLFGVGRDGKRTTLVQWVRMGDFRNAPVPEFKLTTRTAVDKMAR
jgi:hypothetical protein